MEDILTELFERDRNGIERQKAELEQKHEQCPDLIQKTSELTSIDREMLLHIANRTSQHFGDSMPWYRVLEIVQYFYTMKNHVERLVDNGL